MAAESFDKLVSDYIELIDGSPDKLADATISAEKQVWEAIQGELNNLDVKDGKIQSTRKNVRLVSTILESLRTAINRSDYIKAVALFIQDFDKGALLNDAISSQIKQSFTPSQVQLDLLNESKRQTIKVLVGNGVIDRVSQPFAQVLTSAIASRATLSDTVKALRTTIQGDAETDGRLLANVKTTASSALMIADRTYAKISADALNAQWFRYVGKPIDTTRDFCRERASKFYHRKEVEDWADEKWNGKRKGTDRNTIWNFAGGYECRHAIVAVSEFIVPESVKQRARDKGYIK
jgi:hypothetical protein